MVACQHQKSKDANYFIVTHRHNLNTCWTNQNGLINYANVNTHLIYLKIKPSSYSVVTLNVPTQSGAQSFCDELKLQYKTIVKSERLYVRGGRPIPKIHINFSSNKELSEILKSKRMLLDDHNTSYSIEPYVAPSRVLRCYICQKYDDHIVAHCPNKDKPICFKCGQQHSYNPICQNNICCCCAHFKGDHMAGNPNCPKKIKIRELKKMQTKPSSMHQFNSNNWTGNSALHLFGNLTTTPQSYLIIDQMKIIIQQNF